MNISPGWKHLVEAFQTETLFDVEYAKGPPTELINVIDRGYSFILEYKGGDRLTDGYARLVQNLSRKTCKECGKPGEYKFVPVCDDCQ